MHAVYGSGSWGTTLAIVLARTGAFVTLLVRSVAEAEKLSRARENERFLPGVAFPRSLVVSADAGALADAETLTVAIPSEALADGLGHLADQVQRDTVLVSASKGLAESSDSRPMRLTELIAQRLANPVCALSGPNLAPEIARGLPATTVVASHHAGAAERVQRLFSGTSFRVYTSPDVVGVELGGALKNVVAVAAGVADGLNLGDNAKAALLTRGLAEMSRVGRALGADPLTFAGLAGMGDLVATCASPLSRNRRLGQALASGLGLGEAQRQLGQVAEGVPTTRAAVHLARQTGVDMPIAEQMHAVLFEGKNPRQALLDLMQREPKAEQG
ncbi:MAG: NAD(P)-dependent glycerol-3-phosphate dehydrogenase [Chloroflexi bacterium]|nr:NAD(P)-dependent glycerol-3-phosphate dehydrogenase [Chloroflexota bacterium]